MTLTLKSEILKDACNKLKVANDKSGDVDYDGRAEFVVENSKLYLIVKGGEEYVVQIFLSECLENFHATISTKQFIQIIPQVTSSEITLTVDDTTLYIEAGLLKFKLSLVYDNDKILTLPRITIENPTINMPIRTSYLLSMLNANSKEISKINSGNIARLSDCQKYYYLDEQGAITFTDSACVNSFDLDSPVKVLFSSKVVNLFSLLDSNFTEFSFGFDALNDDVMQPKVQFKSAEDKVCITAKFNYDNSLIELFPADTIRNLVRKEAEHMVTFDRESLLKSIKGSIVFAEDANVLNEHKSLGILKFTKDSLEISDFHKNISVVVKYETAPKEEINFTTYVSLKDLKVALESINGIDVSIKFSNNGESILIAKDNIYNVIPLVFYSEV